MIRPVVRASALILALALASPAASSANELQIGLTRISLSPSGGEGNDTSENPVVSSDGSVFAFASTASNLSEGDLQQPGDRDVFVFDAPEGRLENVSRKVDEGIGGWFWKTDCRNPDISADGIDVVYQCFSGYHFAHGMKDHIHRYNRIEGTTRLISTRYSDNNKANGGHWDARISGNGRYTVFTGTASNMVPGDTNRTQDIFLHDNDSDTISRLSVNSAGIEADGPSAQPDISYDGRFVVFSTRASNLAEGSLGGQDQILLLDRERGNLTRLGRGTEPAISDEGNWVSYTSATNAVTGLTEVFLYDVQSATRTSLTTSADGSSYGSRITDGGAFVTFLSEATNLSLRDSDAAADLYRFERSSGTVDLISTNGSTSADAPVATADISTDGTTLVFDSAASNLVGESTNGASDIFAARISGDTEPPQIFASLSSDSLWPPNGKMVTLELSGEIVDNVGVTSVNIRLSDEYGEFDGMEIPGFGPFELRAYRDGGDRDGRQYRVTILASDAAGNETVTELPLVVPHDQGKR